MQNLVLISDSHNQHGKLTKSILEIYKSDPESILIHSGDVSLRGSLNEIEEFLEWYDALPFQNKIFIAGNHDFFFESGGDKVQNLLRNFKNNVIYLQDTGIQINGINFWGSPVTPRFHNWAFNRDEDIESHWKRIPENTDVLITHGPPYGILDTSLRGGSVGCPRLRETIMKIPNLKISCFGHIHEARGRQRIGEVEYVNSSVLSRNHELRSYSTQIQIEKNENISETE